MSDMDGIRKTVERVLRSSLAHIHFRGKFGQTNGEVNEALAPYEDHIKAIMGMLNECLVQASMAGANAVHQHLHQMPGVDNQMLDESVAYAPPDGRIPADDPVKP